ncbi:MAG: hypothetical protein ACTJHT_10690 [Sphingobacterium sp.]|uniref:hypothetical protein n=1 Tax=Sphingobacterium sp. JB170 TaxID=1434842 RepID=UPI00097EA34D|nr:hypothetical protein [Sphingobacterium sp. JB170]SJN48507.1 hypothetical protein FM107_17315 [Sphingobacterium sp. JB170]
MKKLNILLLLGAVFSACGNDNNGGGSKADTSAGVQQMAPFNSFDIIGSYSYEKNGDTVSMHLNLQGDSVMGQLNYALKEKDFNSGSFKGVVEDSVLLATYEFESEGRVSSREIAFKLDGKLAIEGYGEVLEQDYGFKFKDPDQLEFGNGIVLEKQAD